MSVPHQAGRGRSAILATVVAAVAALAVAVPGSANAAPVRPTDDPIYIVQTDGLPAALFTGANGPAGTAGMTATKARPGGKFRNKAPNTRAYQEALRSAHRTVLRRAGLADSRRTADFTNAFNGFAARLSPAEAARLGRTEGVVRVYKSRVVRVATASTPRSLGLDGADGVWQRMFGDPTRAGEGVIIGVIDTGIWPENPSFAALPAPRPDQASIDDKWSGACISGESRPVTCNNKLIGARFYDSTGQGRAKEGEFASPRDLNGHGTHTAGTSAGNHGVSATIDGQGVGTLSGMAPAARIAAYKVLWGADGSGTTTDIVHAIDDAVADGVDVINYSVGDDTDTLGPTDIAFLNASAAGVFVSASAGNSGPNPSTVDNALPWVTTVAASTHDRGYARSVTLGNGQSYPGAGVGPALPSAGLVDSAAAGLPDKLPRDVELCTPGTLDPAKVTGRIVLCKRGAVARTDKSRAVKEAGGVGMIQYNPSPQSLNADYHFVPSIHVGPTEGAAIRSYIAADPARATAALSAGEQVRQRAPEMAEFSAAGPSLSSGGDLLKPDIAAPGVDVLAAVSPAGNHGRDYDLLSGTSMAAPHIAGIAALIRSRYPHWSPMAIKSALMTTAGQTDNEGKPIRRGTADATPLDLGAGQVRPGGAFDPGLVYDSTPEDWLRYTCGIGEHLALDDGAGGTVDGCDVVGRIDPSDLNYASISIGELTGRQTVTRTVTNVTNQASVYVVRMQAPAGYTAKVQVQVKQGRAKRSTWKQTSTLVVRPHQSLTFRVVFARTDAPFGEWSFGSLSLSDTRGHNVRTPIALRARALDAPTETVQSGVQGRSRLSVRTGYAGRLAITPHGLVAGDVSEHRLTGTDAAFDPFDPSEGPGVARHRVHVPTGTTLARFATYDADYAAGTDLDVYVFDADGFLVDASGGGTAQEAVTLGAPPEGDYDIYVVAFGLPAGADGATVELNAFLVGAAPAGNLAASPTGRRVPLGGRVTVTLTWHGLTAGRHYLGVVGYGDGTQTVGQTIVTVNT